MKIIRIWIWWENPNPRQKRYVHKQENVYSSLQSPRLELSLEIALSKYFYLSSTHISKPSRRTTINFFKMIKQVLRFCRPYSSSPPPSGVRCSVRSLKLVNSDKQALFKSGIKYHVSFSDMTRRDYPHGGFGAELYGPNRNLIGSCCGRVAWNENTGVMETSGMFEAAKWAFNAHGVRYLLCVTDCMEAYSVLNKLSVVKKNKSYYAEFAIKKKELASLRRIFKMLYIAWADRSNPTMQRVHAICNAFMDNELGK